MLTEPSGGICCWVLSLLSLCRKPQRGQLQSNRRNLLYSAYRGVPPSSGLALFGFWITTIRDPRVQKTLGCKLLSFQPLPEYCYQSGCSPQLLLSTLTTDCVIPTLPPAKGDRSSLFSLCYHFRSNRCYLIKSIFVCQHFIKTF